MNNIQLIAVLVGAVLPLLVGLLTKGSAPSWIKAVGLLLLASLTAAAASVASGADLKATVLTAVATWGTAVVSHFGLLKPSGLTTAVTVSGVKDQGPAEVPHSEGVPQDYEYEGPVESEDPAILGDVTE